MGLKHGKLDKRIALYAPSEAVDAAGSVVVSYPTITAHRYAMIESLGGSESAQDDEQTPKVRAKITMSFFSALTSAYQIVYEGRTYNVDAVLTHDRRDGHTICTAVEVPS